MNLIPLFVVLLGMLMACSCNPSIPYRHMIVHQRDHRVRTYEHGYHHARSQVRYVSNFWFSFHLNSRAYKESVTNFRFLNRLEFNLPGLKTENSLYALSTGEGTTQTRTNSEMYIES